MTDSIKNFDQLLSLLKDKTTSADAPRAGIVGADDEVLLRAVTDARKKKIVKPLLIGDKQKIEEAAGGAGIDVYDIPLLDLSKPGDMIAKAAMMAADGQFNYLVRGRIPIHDFLRILFDRQLPFRKGKTRISHVAVFEHQKYPRLLLLSDAMVNVAPDIKGKLTIIDNAVRIAGQLGVEKPRVAMLAAVEVIYPGMKVTEEGAVISKMVDKGQIRSCYIDGPLSMDVATVPDVAASKGVHSEVAGQADILIAPNIETGSGVYKAMALFVKARTAGVLTGGIVPVVMPSRCDNIDNIFCSLALGSFLSI